MQIQEKEKLFEVKEYHQKRSLDANSYCWVLCDKIAKKLNDENSNLTKDDVYKDAIKQIGVFEPMIISEKAFDKFKNIWSKQGLGYIVQEVTRKDKCVKVNAYYGSSSYDSKEMSYLIDLLVNMAKDLNIEVRPQNEIDNLLNSWR
jgi:hypothetical protein